MSSRDVIDWTGAAFHMSSQKLFLSVLLLLIVLSCSLSASVFGTIKVIVHDSQHRPVQHAKVMVESTSSDLKQTANTDAEGIATVLNVPVGEHRISVSALTFDAQQQLVMVASGTLQELHFQ